MKLYADSLPSFKFRNPNYIQKMVDLDPARNGIGQNSAVKVFSKEELAAFAEARNIKVSPKSEEATNDLLRTNHNISFTWSDLRKQRESRKKHRTPPHRVT